VASLAILALVTLVTVNFDSGLLQAREVARLVANRIGRISP
jgi:hypothetical protein